MKKIANLIFLLLIFISVSSFAETEMDYAFTFNSEIAGSGKNLDLSEYGLSFFLPDGFEQKDVLNNNRALCYYQRNNPWHSVEFLSCDYNTLDDAKKEYADVTPILAEVNGLNGIIFAYKTLGKDGKELFICDVFIEVPNHMIVNYFEESADQKDLALYLCNILPDESTEKAASQESKPDAETLHQENSTVLESSDTDSEKTTKSELPDKINEKRSIRTQKDGTVNVRKSPSPDSERIGSAAPDSIFPLISVSENGWYEIRLRDGTTGFISPNLGRIIE